MIVSPPGDRGALARIWRSNMSTMQDGNSACVPAASAAPARRSAWDIWELAVGYSLILLVIWTPRPEQRWFYWSAVLWFAVSLYYLLPGSQGAWLSHGRVLPFTVGRRGCHGAVRSCNHAGEQSSHVASSQRTSALGRDFRWICRLVVFAAVPDAGIFFAAPVARAAQPDLGGHHGGHHLCDGASAQPDSYPDHA